jgi:cyclopropane-fatty-acyl-phospholipid synthase
VTTSDGSPTHLTAPVEDVQAHYDLSNDFFTLFLDPSMTYSCAYFERDGMTLEEAQHAKRKLSLDKLNLEPGMTLLDVGCGWGSTMRQAIEEYDVDVIGLTLSENQYAYNQQKLAAMDTPRRKEVRLQGWEEFDEPVDRIVSIGAFEHFAGPAHGGFERYDSFFKMCYNVLPDDGRMLLHTITQADAKEVEELGLKVTMTVVRFAKFMLEEIFPGGRLPSIPIVDEYSARSGFKTERHHRIGSNYVPTLDAWAAALEAKKDQAIEMQGQQTYDTYMHYLTGCSNLFRDRYIDVCQFTLVK